MKKALTIYVDDDADLKSLCGAFVCWNGTNNCLTMMNVTIPDDATGLYLPFGKPEEPTWTQWIMRNGAQE